jgi:hypothetical protein
MPFASETGEAMNAIRDWFKSLRLAILAGRATFDMEQYRARKRRKLPN